MNSALGGERLARLRAAKLSAVAQHIAGSPGLESAVSVAYPTGAGLVGHGEGWLLEEALSPRSAGRILLWALRHDIHHLVAIVGGGSVGGGSDGGGSDGGESVGGTVDRVLVAEIGRRLAAFDVDVDLHRLVGTQPELVPPAPARHIDTAVGGHNTEAALYAPLFERVGVELVAEGAEVHGEVLGLEVARVVDGALEVGVGRFDREITSMLHADLPSEAALARAADIVRQHRYRGAPPHPMLSMGRERWLRRELVAHPVLVGCTSVWPIPTTVPIPNLRDPHPAAALASTDRGEIVTVVCGVGLDVDLVPIAADVAMSNPESDLVLVVPEGELLPPLRSIADHLRRGARWLELPAPWGNPPAA